MITLDTAKKLDQDDTLKEFQKQFSFPKDKNGNNKVYLCGNSLGLCPLKAEEYVLDEIQSWKSRGVEGHFEGKRPWMPYHENILPLLAEIVGAKENEVVPMNTLSTNLHLLLRSFYAPKGKKTKVITEAKTFPSDQYIIDSHLKTRGIDPHKNNIIIGNKEKLEVIDHELFLESIEKHAFETCLVFISGVHYLTGQAFKMKEIAQLCQKHDILFGVDLAHAVGNIPLQLHDWGVDFAAWCSYKYLNSGPGGISGLFVHEKHVTNKELIHYAGWWGHDKNTRFKMPDEFNPILSAERFQLSNPPIFQLASHLASLEIFHEAGMDRLRQKSLKLTSFLEDLLQQELSDKVQILTPQDPHERGAQLSLLFQKDPNEKFVENLSLNGLICDFRNPNLIRFAPTPLYNRFEDVFQAVSILKKSLGEI